MKQWYIRIPEDGKVHGPYDTESDASDDAYRMKGLDAEIFSKGEPAMVCKITHGYVNQKFEGGVCVEQSFTAGDPVEFEDEDSNPLLDRDAIESLPTLYHTFDMIQPGRL